MRRVRDASERGTDFSEGHSLSGGRGWGRGRRAREKNMRCVSKADEVNFYWNTRAKRGEGGQMKQSAPQCPHSRLRLSCQNSRENAGI